MVRCLHFGSALLLSAYVAALCHASVIDSNQSIALDSEVAEPAGQSSVKPGSVVVDTDQLTRLAKYLAREEIQQVVASTNPVNAFERMAEPVMATAPVPVSESPGSIDENTPLGQPRTGLRLASGTSGPTTSSWIVQTAVGLAAVVGLILIGRGVIGKLAGRSSVVGRCSAIQVLARVPVTPRSYLLLIRLGSRILAVSESGSELHTLADISDGSEVAELLAAVTADKPGSSSANFANLFSRFNSEYREEQDIDDEVADQGEFHVDRTRDQISNLASGLRVLGHRRGKME